MTIKYGTRTYENFVKTTQSILNDLNKAKNILINNKEKELSAKCKGERK